MNIPDDYAATRRAAGLMDLSSRGRIVVRGADRKTFLHALLTNDIALLGPGTGCYAALLTPQGRMLADMDVFELGDVTLLDTPREVKDLLLQRLDQLIFSEDVQLGDLSDAWDGIGIYGPNALRLAGASLGVDLGGFQPFQAARFDRDSDVVIAARRDGLGLPGARILAPAGRVPALMRDAAARGAVLLSAASAEVLRVEAGEPAFLVDMDGDTIPFEAGIEDRAISFQKGCFPGQEVLVRIRDRGHGKVARKLVGLSVDGGAVPAAGSRVADGEKDVGQVTSAVMSPALGRPIALGYVHRDSAEPGRAVTIVDAAGPLAATVTPLPFVES